MPLDPSHLAGLPAFLTISEAAELLRVSRSSAYEYVLSGRLPAVRFGGRAIRVPRAALLRLAGEEPVSAPREQAPDQHEPAGGGTAAHGATEA